MLWHSLFWILVHPEYGIVLVHYRHLGGAGLILSFSRLASITLICVLVWVDLIHTALIHFVWQLLVVLGLFALIWPSSLLAGSVDRTKLGLSLYMSGNSPQGEQLHIYLMRILSRILKSGLCAESRVGGMLNPLMGDGYFNYAVTLVLD